MKMKKILIIGKYGKIMDNLNQCLCNKFAVQLCKNDPEAVREIVKMVKPNLIVISLSNMPEEENQILEHLKQKYNNTPVLIIGTGQECNFYFEYFKETQFDKLLKPVTREKLLEKCLGRIGEYESGTPGDQEPEKKKSILIVDDSALMLRGLKSMLEDSYRIYLANGGRKAVETAAAKQPDLILLDYEMPDMNGKETLEKLRENQETASIPVLFLTSIADKNHIAAVLQMKPAGYILKPPEKDSFLKTISEILSENSPV